MGRERVKDISVGPARSPWSQNRNHCEATRLHDSKSPATWKEAFPIHKCLCRQNRAMWGTLRPCPDSVRYYQGKKSDSFSSSYISLSSILAFLQPSHPPRGLRSQIRPRLLIFLSESNLTSWDLDQMILQLLQLLVCRFCPFRDHTQHFHFCIQAL